MEERPLLAELCSILYRRNQIETRRRRSQGKIRYYELILTECVAQRAYAELIKFRQSTADPAKRKEAESRYNSHHRYPHDLVNMDNKPIKQNKWLKDMRGLRKRILKHKAEYMVARYDAAKLTEETHNKVIKITKKLNANINYSRGSGMVDSITIRYGGEYNEYKRIEKGQFYRYYQEIEANKAIERMLRHESKEKAKG